MRCLSPRAAAGSLSSAWRVIHSPAGACMGHTCRGGVGAQRRGPLAITLQEAGRSDTQGRQMQMTRERQVARGGHPNRGLDAEQGACQRTAMLRSSIGWGVVRACLRVGLFQGATCDPEATICVVSLIGTPSQATESTVSRDSAAEESDSSSSAWHRRHGRDG